MADKIVIYQLFPRLFGNDNKSFIPNGSLAQNGCGKFQDIDSKALDSLIELGINHIWLTGILRHATATAYDEQNLPSSHPQILKGLAGSPYAVKDYYDVDPDLAMDIGNRMGEFKELVERIHDKGLKVIIDFVPNHVSRDYNSISKPLKTVDLGEKDDISCFFSSSNNFYYLPGQKLSLPLEVGDDGYNEYPARATGNDCFSPTPSMNDWYETIKLNYGINPQTGEKFFNPIPDTWNKMTDILRFWSEMGVDGFRCDMAGMVPVEFWNYSIGKIKDEFKHIIFIAELYEPQQYRSYIETGGFDYLYDKVGLYDCLRDIITGNNTSAALSRVWESLDGLDKSMLRFMENHDEQRIASPRFLGDPWKGLPAIAVSSFMNSGPVMIYNGQEVGEGAKGAIGFSGDDGRTSIFDYCSMPEFQKWRNDGLFDGQKLTPDQVKLNKSYSTILNFARKQSAMMGLFYDLMWQNQDLEPSVRDKIYAFLRYTKDSTLLMVISFDPGIRQIKIRIPLHALEMAGISGQSHFTISELHPSKTNNNLMLSQINSSGIPVKFDNTGWAAIKLI